MALRFRFFIVAIFCITLGALSFPISIKADTSPEPRSEGTPYDLINAVNALRAEYGQPPYSINSILMYTAQAQADFMAATGTVTHFGPGGIGVTERLLAAGYPLAGDLSLGGFRSENIIGGVKSMSAQTAVDQWTGDSPHLTTMISPDLTEIGAGVAMANGRVYYVIDCARPTTVGASQISTTPIAGGSAVPESEATVQPIQTVVVSTPNPEGNVIHEVKYGQSLWQIAIAYETKINEIKRLNNLAGNDIYPGQKLVIKTGILAPTTAPSETSTPEPEPSAIATSMLTFIVSTATSQGTIAVTFTPAVISPSSSSFTTMGIVISIVTLALLGGGVITWVGAKKGDD